MAIELFNNGKHQCLMFDDLVDDSLGDAVQANQFLIVDNGHGALIDPGGNMTYNGLLMEMHNYFPPKKLEYILASPLKTVTKTWGGLSLTKTQVDGLQVKFVFKTS